MNRQPPWQGSFTLKFVGKAQLSSEVPTDGPQMSRRHSKGRARQDEQTKFCSGTRNGARMSRRTFPQRNHESTLSDETLSSKTRSEARRTDELLQRRTKGQGEQTNLCAEDAVFFALFKLWKLYMNLNIHNWVKDKLITMVYGIVYFWCKNVNEMFMSGLYEEQFQDILFLRGGRVIFLNKPPSMLVFVS